MRSFPVLPDKTPQTFSRTMTCGRSLAAIEAPRKSRELRGSVESFLPGVEKPWQGDPAMTTSGLPTVALVIVADSRSATSHLAWTSSLKTEVAIGETSNAPRPRNPAFLNPTSKPPQPQKRLASVGLSDARVVIRFTSLHDHENRKN